MVKEVNMAIKTQNRIAKAITLFLLALLLYAYTSPTRVIRTYMFLSGHWIDAFRIELTKIESGTNEVYYHANLENGQLKYDVIVVDKVPPFYFSPRFADP